MRDTARIRVKQRKGDKLTEIQIEKKTENTNRKDRQMRKKTNERVRVKQIEKNRQVDRKKDRKKKDRPTDRQTDGCDREQMR